MPYAPTIKDDNLLALCFFACLNISIFFSLSASHIAFAALAITAEHSFWLNSHSFPSNVKQAAKLYIKSDAAISVSQQIQAAFQDKSSEIPNIIKGDYSQYTSHIALLLSDIISNNLLGMSLATYYWI